jgi:hypothetical protein
MALAAKSVGPFMGVTKDKVVEKGGRKFRLVLYGAYNAFGLIGSECNGIAVLDEDRKEVVLDEEAKIPSGYYGPSESQKKRFKEIRTMTWEDFRAWVNAHPRRRHEI